MGDSDWNVYLRALLQQAMNASEDDDPADRPVIQIEELDSDGTSELDEESLREKIPATLPILPLRGVVVYPQTAVPLNIGRPRSIRLVDDVVAGDRLIGLVTALDMEKEDPGVDTGASPFRRTSRALLKSFCC